MFVLTLVLSAGSTYLLYDATLNKQRSNLTLTETQQATALASYIEARSASYRQALRGAAGMINIKGRNAITTSDWNTYTSTLMAGNKFKELLGIGFADAVSHDQLQAYESAESVRVAPSGVRDLYTPIRFLYPETERNLKAIGFDMYSEKSRRDAMLRAKTSGEASASAPVVAVQDETSSASRKPVSILMCYPVYRDGLVNVPKDQRDEKIIGYTYLIYRPIDVFAQQDVLNDVEISHYHVQDITEQGSPNEIYTSEKYEPSPNSIERNLTLNDRTWKVTFYSENNYSRSLASPQNTILVIGIFLSLLLAYFVYSMLSKRSRTLQLEHAENIQKTKDELLALASHQLRTPATGVRQYIGMLKKGYFGALNPEQIDIAEKAYGANERQLEIIDQLLIVAKADAGQLKVTAEKIDIVTLVHSAIDELADTTKNKGIAIKRSLPKSLYCTADEKFSMMIIENLLSNAVKYSYKKSTIKITLKNNRDLGMVEFSVADTGVGIDANDESKLFQKFSRIDNEFSRSEGGSGLGLYLAKMLALSQGGDLLYAKNSGGGSTFTLLLPTKQNVV